MAASFSNSQEKKKKMLPYDNFGSFFGPSKRVISQKARKLIENQLSSSTNGGGSSSSSSSKKTPLTPVVIHETHTKSKLQMLKENRDYSFLFSQESAPPTKQASSTSSPNDSISAATTEKSNPNPVVPAKKSAGGEGVLQKTPPLSKLLHSSHKNPQHEPPKRDIKEAEKKTKPRSLDRTKKRTYVSDDEGGGEDVRVMIRKMFGYDPSKYAGNDYDDRNMEANFADILKEENRSARIAREEDKRELRRIEQEERQERLRKEAKKRTKLCNQPA